MYPGKLGFLTKEKKSKPQRFSSQRQLNTSSGDSGTRQRLPLRGKLTLRGAGSAAWTQAPVPAPAKKSSRNDGAGSELRSCISNGRA